MKKNLRTAKRNLRRFGSELKATGRNLTQSVTLPLAALGAASVKAFADIERFETALKTALGGGAEEARKELEKLRKAAEAPGLNFEQAVQGSVRLQAVGLNAEQAREALSNFGNAIALAGGTSEQLDGVTLALQQIVSKGKIAAEEINQLSERVPQVRQAIQSAFGTADSEELQKLGVDVTTFVQRVTEEIGKLPQAEETLSNSLTNIAVATKLALADFGRIIDETFNLRKVLAQLTESIGRTVEWFKSLSDEGKRNVLIFASVAAAIGPALVVLGQFSSLMGSTIVNLRKLVIVLKSVAVSGFSALLSPIGLVITAIALLGASVLYVIDNWEAFKEAALRVWVTLAKKLNETIEQILRSQDKFLGVFGINSNFAERFSFKFNTEYEFEGKTFKTLGDYAGQVKDFAKRKLGLIPLGSFQVGGVDGADLTGATQGGETPSAPGRGLAQLTEQQKEVADAASNVVSVLREQGAAIKLTSLEVVNLSGANAQLVASSDAAKESLLSFLEEGITDQWTTTAEAWRSGVEAIGLAVEGASDRLRSLGTAVINTNNAIGEGLGVFNAYAKEGITSAKKLSKAFVDAGKAIILNLIQQGIAAAITNVLKTAGILGPIALGLASSAGLAVKGLFSSILGTVKLAEGGLVYGPTLATVGDNPNARVDPEVVAPLSKLEAIISKAIGGGSGEVTIRGEDIVIALARANQRLGRVQ